MSQSRTQADSLYSVLNRHANLGIDCPHSSSLARLAGFVRADGVSRPLCNLAKRKLITMVERGRDRHVTITATGKTTIIPGYSKRSGIYVQPPTMPEDLVHVDRDPCPVCGVRKDVCTGHNHKPTQYIPSALWRELVSALPKDQTA